MDYSKHARRRMSQRGIPDRLVALTQKFGRLVGDRVVLDRREARQALDELDEERALLLKAIDKGGLVVVESGDRVVTTFNITERQRHV